MIGWAVINPETDTPQVYTGAKSSLPYSVRVTGQFFSLFRFQMLSCIFVGWGWAPGLIKPRSALGVKLNKWL